MTTRRFLLCPLVIGCLGLACSDDNGSPADAAIDNTVVGPDSCCGDGPLTDQPPPGPDSCCADLPPAPDLPPLDLPPVVDLPSKVDFPAVPDLGGGKKLIAWAQCSKNTKCKPYCGAIGSKSEGWYDGCTDQLLKNPTTGNLYWDQCIKCVVSCDAIGSYSEGWYAQCP